MAARVMRNEDRGGRKAEGGRRLVLGGLKLRVFGRDIALAMTPPAQSARNGRRERDGCVSPVRLRR